MSLEVTLPVKISRASVRPLPGGSPSCSNVAAALAARRLIVVAWPSFGLASSTGRLAGWTLAPPMMMILAGRRERGNGSCIQEEDDDDNDDGIIVAAGGGRPAGQPEPLVFIAARPSD